MFIITKCLTTIAKKNFIKHNSVKKLNALKLLEIKLEANLPAIINKMLIDTNVISLVIKHDIQALTFGSMKRYK